MRTGDFSELGRPIRDPLTNQPFPGARIPQFRLDPAARQFLERFVPLPNAGERRFTAALNEPMDGNQYLTRVDYELSPNDRLYGRYILNQDEIFGPQGNVPGFGLDQTFVRQSASLNETHTFGATLVNNVSFTFNRVRANIDGGPKFLWSDLGARIPVSSPLNQYGRSIVNVTGYFMSSTGVDWRLVRHAYLFNDTLSWQYGRHFFKFGTQLSLYTLSQINDYLGRGQFTFSGFATGGTGGRSHIRAGAKFPASLSADEQSTPADDAFLRAGRDEGFSAAQRQSGPALGAQPAFFGKG